MSRAPLLSLIVLLGVYVLTAGCGEDITAPILSSEIVLEVEDDSPTPSPATPPSPDLVIEKIIGSCSGVEVTVRNASTGGVAYGRFTVSVSSPQGFTGSSSWGTTSEMLWPGQSVVITVPDGSCQEGVCADEGRHYVVAVVDDADQIRESNEGNNSRRAKLSLPGC